MNGPRAHAVNFKRCHGYPEVEDAPDDMFFEIPDLTSNVISLDNTYAKLLQNLQESFEGVEGAILAGRLGDRETGNKIWDVHDEELLQQILNKDQTTTPTDHYYQCSRNNDNPESLQEKMCQHSRKNGNPVSSEEDIFESRKIDNRETSRNQQILESRENSKKIQHTLYEREVTVAESTTKNIIPKRQEHCLKIKDKKKRLKVIEKDKKRLKHVEQQTAPEKMSDKIYMRNKYPATENKICKTSHDKSYFQNKDVMYPNEIDSNGNKELECDSFVERTRTGSSSDTRSDTRPRTVDMRRRDECNNASGIKDVNSGVSGGCHEDVRSQTISAHRDKNRKRPRGIRVNSDDVEYRRRRESKPKRVGFKLHHGPGIRLSPDPLENDERRDINKSNVKDQDGETVRKSRVRIRLSTSARSDNPRDDTVADVSELNTNTIPEGGESDPEEIQSEESVDYDYDGEYKDPPPIGDLSTFDFQHITKREKELDPIQIEYQNLSYRARVRPVGYILRNISSIVLRLKSLCLGETRIKIMCAALLVHTNLRTLEISEDNINRQTMQHIIEVIAENWVIENLLLHDNKMGKQPVKLLLGFLMNSDQLLSLTLGGNSLEDTDGVMITDYLNMTTNLTVLDLSHNHLGLQSAELLCKVLTKNATVHTLSLSWNHMTGRATEAFLKCLIKNKTIVNLDMSFNGFETESMETLIKALRVNNVLCSLDISACRIRGEQLMDLVGAIKKNTGLRHITLGHNIFSGHKLLDALMDLSKFKGEIGLKEMDFKDIPVLPPVKDLAIQLMEQKDLIVMHGPIIGRFEGKETDEDILATQNPSTILKEFANLMGMTLEVLFEYMDVDGDQTLSRDEIKEGLRRFGIPIPQRSLDLLIRQMDRNGDGVISLHELLGYDRNAVRSRIADVLYSIERELPGEESGGTRCRKILQRMLANKGNSAGSASEEEEGEESDDAKDDKDDEEKEKFAKVDLADEDQDGNNSYSYSLKRRLSLGDGRTVKLPPLHINNKVTG